MKRRGTALVVIGNSILQGIMIPTDPYLAEIAESVGLELIDVHTPRATRVGNSIIHSDVRVAKARESHRLYESVAALCRESRPASVAGRAFPKDYLDHATLNGKLRFHVTRSVLPHYRYIYPLFSVVRRLGALGKAS